VLPFLLSYLETAQNDEKIHILSTFAVLLRDVEINSDHSSLDALSISQTLQQGIVQYMVLVEDEDTAIKGMAVYILGFCWDKKEDAVSSLKKQFAKETNGSVKYVIILSIAMHNGDCSQELLNLLLSEKEFIVRYALSLVITNTMGGMAPMIVDDILSESFIACDLLEEPFLLVPYERDVITNTCLALSHLPQKRSLSILEKALSSHRLHGTPMDIIQLVEYGLDLAAFSKMSTDDWTTAVPHGNEGLFYRLSDENRNVGNISNLSQEQVIILLALLKCEPFWQIRTNLLAAYALPMTKQGLQEFLHSR
jgi:hypothetical protein